MLEKIFKRPKKLEVVRKSSLREYINDYLTDLKSLGYKATTIKNYAYMLLRFAEFLDKQKEYHIRDLRKWIDTFLRPSQKAYYRKAKLGIIGSFVRYLQNKGIVYCPSVTKSIYEKKVERYEAFLRERLNLAEQSIYSAKSYCLKFLRYIDTIGIKDLRDVKPKIVQQFVQSGPVKPSKSLICCRHWAVKKYLSYLKSLGEIQRDFSKVLIAPRP